MCFFYQRSRSHKKHIERFNSELDPELYGKKYWFVRGKFWGMNDYKGVDKSLARPTSRCILFDGENISFDASLFLYIYIYIYINKTSIKRNISTIHIYIYV